MEYLQRVQIKLRNVYKAYRHYKNIVYNSVCSLQWPLGQFEITIR